MRNDDLPALRALIRNPGPKALDARGNSPLMFAAAPGSAESMRLLLGAGADPNIANNLGATPLMWCAGDVVKVRMLLDKGAKVNVRSKLGRTPLQVAAAYDGGLEAARLLIGKGAAVNAVDYLLRTQKEDGSWHVASRSYSRSSHTSRPASRMNTISGSLRPEPTWRRSP